MKQKEGSRARMKTLGVDTAGDDTDVWGGDKEKDMGARAFNLGTISPDLRTRKGQWVQILERWDSAEDSPPPPTSLLEVVRLDPHI